jgi:surface polysaccharide O-acyltransferase-like enzyme
MVKNRLLWPDIMKILAIFGVILLHVSAPYLVPFEDSRDWWVGNVYDSMTRWSVPLFIMLSGALILPFAEKVPLRRFLLVKVGRILLPFLVWSAIYFVYRLQVKGDDLAAAVFFRMLLTEPIYYHLWFVYMLIVLYLFAPTVSAFLKGAPEKHVWYLIGLWFFWASILPIIDTPLDFEPYFTPDLDDYSAIRLSGYFLLGYTLRNRQAGSGIQWALILLFFLAGAGATIFGTFYLSRSRGEFDPFFYKYFSATVAAMAVALFLMVKSLFAGGRINSGNGGAEARLNSSPMMRRIGMSVFGIYLAHALVLELLRDGRLGFTIDHTSAFGMEMPLAAGLPIFALSIFLLSLGSVLVIRFIPGLREMLT